jgi:hypothetical protein
LIIRFLLFRGLAAKFSALAFPATAFFSFRQQPLKELIKLRVAGNLEQLCRQFHLLHLVEGALH